MASVAARQRYEFNPECPCDVCASAGSTALSHSSAGSYSYGQPHIPPAAGRYPATVGQGSTVANGAHLGHGTRIGRNCRIAPGAVLGWEGFGYLRGENGGWERKPETHGIVIGDDVDVGACTTIDRGSYRDTLIGGGTKIDNLVHIGHNCLIGEDCIIVAGAEISGSVVVGDGAWIGPNASIREHVIIGARALVGIGAVILKDVPENQTWGGNPAGCLNAEIGVRDQM